MDLEKYYRVYSNYLRDEYGQKVYKLPLNIPCTCPNRDGSKDTKGCIFCGASGSGYELLSEENSITSQLEQNSELIKKKYKAEKFIGYFQSFSNTYLPFEDFKKYINEAIVFDGIVELSISTRPDAITEEQLEFLSEIQNKEKISITIELGLQSSNDNTLKILNRHHTVEDFKVATDLIHKYGIKVCAHLIIDLPWDNTEDILNLSKLINETKCEFVKIHSLYVEKDTELEKMYNNGLRLLSSDDFIDRSILFLENLNPNIVIERLVGRIPEENSVFANWNRSWWIIRDQLVEKMNINNTYQGKNYKDE